MEAQLRQCPHLERVWILCLLCRTRSAAAEGGMRGDYGSLIQDRCDGLIQDHLPPDRRVVTV